MMAASEVKKVASSLVVHGFLASLFIACLIEETSSQAEKLYEKYGFTGHATFGGRFKYATFIGLLFQVAYFSMSTVNAIIEIFVLWSGKNLSLQQVQNKNQLRDIINVIYTGFAAPSAMFVVSQFWALYAIDRNLIFSELHEKAIPSHRNHIMHTLPLFAIVIENYFFRHFYHKSFLRGVIPTAMFTVTYLSWILIVRYNTGVWVYPFLDHMSHLGRALFISFGVLYLIGMYKLCQLLNSYFWDIETRWKRKILSSF